MKATELQRCRFCGDRYSGMCWCLGAREDRAVTDLGEILRSMLWALENGDQIPDPESLGMLVMTLCELAQVRAEQEAS